MLVSREWLQDYFDTSLPSAEDIVHDLTFHSFEVESFEHHGDDAIIDVDVLANRAHDCLSHRGIAKELSAIRGLALTKDPLRENVPEQEETSKLSISIEDTKGCYRYSGAYLENVEVGESPEWLKARLAALGQKSVNNVVDALNYVMFDIGQPLHAFDADKLASQDGAVGLSVRFAKDGEETTTLTGETYALTESDLLIADTHSGSSLGIAGIKGGQKAEVDENTKNIVIESATFRADVVRETSGRIGIRTDASKRFENQLAPELAQYGLAEALKYVREVAGGELDGVIDEYPVKSAPYVLGVSTDEVNQVLGTHMGEDDISRVLTSLAFPWGVVSPKEYVCEQVRKLEGTPYERGASISKDAPNAFDCSSLTAYLYAHAGIPIPRMSVDQYVFGKEVSREELSPGDLVFSNTGEGSIYYETQEFLAGTSVPEGVDHCGIYLGDGEVAHATNSKGGVTIEPLDESEQFKNIVGFRRVAMSERRFVITVPFERLDLRIPEDLIEEIGRLHGYEQIPRADLPSDGEKQFDAHFVYAQKVRDILTSNGLSEVYTYTFGPEGDRQVTHPLASDKACLRASLISGMREALKHNAHYQDLLALSRIAIFEIGNVFPESGEYTALAVGVHDARKKAKPDEAAEHALNTLSEQLGANVHAHETNREVQDGYAVVELNLDALISALPEPEHYIGAQSEESVEYEPLSPYPFVMRDIAVWMPEGTESSELYDVITAKAGEWLASTRLFDEFHRDDHVSYAFRLAFQSHEKTLTDEEVNEVMEQIYKTVEEKGWTVR